jgi:hypothetical protein
VLYIPRKVKFHLQKKDIMWAGGMVPVVELWPRKLEALSSNPVPYTDQKKSWYFHVYILFLVYYFGNGVM